MLLQVYEFHSIKLLIMKLSYQFKALYVTKTTFMQYFTHSRQNELTVMLLY